MSFVVHFGLKSHRCMLKFSNAEATESLRRSITWLDSEFEQGAYCAQTPMQKNVRRKFNPLSTRKLFQRILIGYAFTFAIVAPSNAATATYSRDTKIVTVLKTRTNDVGNPLRYPLTDHPEVTVIRVTLSPGTRTGWHTHPVQGVAYILSGELTIHSKNFPTHIYRAGQSFAESVGVLHEGANEGTKPVVLLVVFMGVHGQPFAAKSH